jgi:hypothetical protein
VKGGGRTFQNRDELERWPRQSSECRTADSVRRERLIGIARVVACLFGGLSQQSVAPHSWQVLSAHSDPMLAYLIDHISIHAALVISSVVSIFLVVSYLRIVVGPRFAFVEAALAQIIYLVGFSYAFFFEGFTGLAITIGAIVTLFVVMQMRWINWGGRRRTTPWRRQEVGNSRSSDPPKIEREGHVPVVFVHGVNTRKSPSYDANVAVIDAFVQKHMGGAGIGGKPLPPKPKTTFPYWGDLGMTFAWNMASLPRPQMQALGGTGDINLQEILGHIRDAFPELPKDDPLTALAKKQFSLAVDAINHLALKTVDQGDEKEVAEFVVVASAYAEANPQPAWLAQVQSDQDLLNQLAAQIQGQPGVQALGGFGAAFNKIKLAAVKLKQAVTNMAGKAVDKAGDFASTKLLASTRDALNETLGRFFGDVFIYLDSRGDQANPGKIPSLILKAYDEARAAAPNEPFIIIGHSLGGVISMDLLSHFRPDIDVDLFVSVGSQIAHFEELKLYKISDPAVKAPKKATTPANIKRWINIFDEVDIFSYSVDRVFDRVNVDAPYDTQTYTIKAHGAYFEQDRFYQRLRARINALKP